jgi:carotenoid cleavage dioxygenase
MPYAFDEKAGARIGVMRRDLPAKGVRWLEIDPCYFFHPMNASNTGESIRVDVARYPELWRNDSLHFGSAFLHRYEIDLAGGTVRESALDDLAIEFPRIREDRCGLPNRFGYAASTRDDGVVVGTGLVRYDLETGKREVFERSRESLPSEAVFVPAAPTASEGEGWLLAYLHDPGCGPSELAVFDATRLAAGPVARVKLPQRVPLGFHGSWIAEADLTS